MNGKSSRQGSVNPANHQDVIAVGATDQARELAFYSNSGRGIELVAPGGNARVDLDGDGFRDGIYQETRFRDGIWGIYWLHGTSMAAPHVSAAAALVRSADPGLSATQVRRALRATALDLGRKGRDRTYGYGLVQASSALHAALGTSDPTDGDGDGFSPADGDCNDQDNTVYPGQRDTKGPLGRNGIDNDCNGVIDG